MSATRERSLVLPVDAVRTLLAGQSLTLTLPWKGDEPTEPLRPLEDLLSSAKRGRPALVWGHDLPPSGPSAGTLEYQDGTRRELRVERVRTWAPPWQPGEVAWCRETWGQWKHAEGEGEPVLFNREERRRAEKRLCLPPAVRWRSSTTMPRWAARLFAEVAEVRPERGEGGWRWVTTFRRLEP